MAVLELGLSYPPDPASRAISTLGGNIATNAGGACCLRYGVTGDHVAALSVVLAGGTVIRTGATTGKDVAGLDLTRLVVGSEGTLGVIVEATVRLQPVPPPAATLAASFSSIADAGRAVVAMADSADLSLIELLDTTTLRAVERHAHLDLDTDAAALVLVQSDSSRPGNDVAVAADIGSLHHATAVLPTQDPDEGEALLAARRLALPALERLGDTMLDDVAVPRPAIPQLLMAVAAIAQRHGLVIGTFGHAGDGNFHPTIVFDAADAGATASAHTAFLDIAVESLRLGGTVTGEHGVGVLKRGLLAQQRGADEIALMHRIKAAFDPQGILNPGKAY